MMLIPRVEWGARPRKYINKEIMSAESTAHWNGPTLTIGGSTTWDHSKCASIVRGIQNFHMDGRKWSDIAYNFLICPHGYIFEGRGLNVVNGANGTVSGNQSSHAICCLAGEDNPFSNNEKIGFRQCVNYIDVNTLAPGTCKGHRDHKATTCPGDERYDWVHKGMPIPISPPIVDKGKEKDMDAALALIKAQYDNVRGDKHGSYDVAVSDSGGWIFWLNSLLDAYDKNQPLKVITDRCGALLYIEATK